MSLQTLRVFYAVGMEQFMERALRYLKHPLVLRGSVALGFLYLLQKIIDPAVLGLLTQADARAVLLTVIWCGFAAVHLVMQVAERSSGP